MSLRKAYVIQINLNHCKVTQDLLEQTTYESQMEIVRNRDGGDVSEDYTNGDHKAIVFELRKEPQARKAGYLKPRRASGCSAKALDVGSFLELWLDEPSKASGPMESSPCQKMHHLGGAHSPIEDPITGGIVNWPAFDQPTTEPDEQLREQ